MNIHNYPLMFRFVEIHSTDRAKHPESENLKPKPPSSKMPRDSKDDPQKSQTTDADLLGRN